MTIPNLNRNPIHLGLGSTAIPQPAFTGTAWYADYVERHGGDGNEGRLVTIHSFSEDWDMWEMHPEGSEVVVCIKGAMTLHQERPNGSSVAVVLGEGDYAINDPGVWHTADVNGNATALFITAGIGTEHRPR
jgi:quercetin dioxygenase-like cupin family protein